MTKRAQILILLAFLAVIYVVPLTQTFYEYSTNSGHRIQMGDLIEDIFVTPMNRAKADAVALDTLELFVQKLGTEIEAGRAMAADTSRTWDPAAAVAAADESLIKVKLLRESVINYNRHIQGEKNHFAAADTTKPYYKALGTLQDALTGILSAVQSGDPASAAGLFAAAEADAGQAKKLFGGHKGLKALPGLTLTALRRTLIGADYLRPYEKEMEKSSVFANAIRPWMLFGYYGLYEDLGDKGVLGKNGWYFYRPDVDYLIKNYIFDKRSQIVDANDAPITESIIDTIAAFKNELASRGIDLLVVIMPTKASIYPDLLNPAMKASQAGTFSHSLRIMNELNRAGVQTVDLFAAFAAERANDAVAGDSIYLHTDTHFRGRGVLATARAVAGQIRQYPWYEAGTTEYAIDTVDVPRFGDVAEMTKLPALAMHKLKFSFAPEATKCYQVYKVDRDEAGAETGRSLYKDDYIRSRVLVLGDSFSRIYQTDEPRSAGWISHLALELGQPVASLVNDGGASTLVRQTLARKPGLLRNKKLVVWEIVERDFRFGAEGWKHVQIAAADMQSK